MQLFKARPLPGGVASLIATATVVAFSAGCKPATFHGTIYEPVERAPSVILRQATGGQFSLADQHGNVVLLFFGYTHCPDICPTTLSDWKRVKKGLGRDASRVRFVFISIDPMRDDSATLHRYVSRFDPDFIAATGDSTTLASIERSFHITSSREDNGSANGYSVGHPSQTFVVDKHGDLRMLYSFGIEASDMVSDIRQLLRGE